MRRQADGVISISLGVFFISQEIVMDEQKPTEQPKHYVLQIHSVTMRPQVSFTPPQQAPVVLQNQDVKKDEEKTNGKVGE